MLKIKMDFDSPTTPPEPYKTLNPKALLLGCDPTAFTKEEKKKNHKERNPIRFGMVFGLENKSHKYFGVINSNLLCINLD